MTSEPAANPGPAPARSYLYVPADNSHRLDKSLGLGADAVIADLEDGVGPGEKAAARENLAAWLAAAAGGSGPQRWVRIDPEAMEDDVAAAASSAVTGLVVAKADAAVVKAVDELLVDRERAVGRAPGSIALIPLIESAAALLDVLAIARAARVLRLAVGEVDLSADLGLRAGPDGAEFAHHRFQIVAASAAAGIGRPVGPTSTDFRDLDGFADSAERLLRQGFRARTAIHPAQVPVIHRVFTPSAAEVDAALDLLDRLAAAGGGVAVDARGRMIDAAVARSAHEVVATARSQDHGSRGRSGR